MGIGNWNVKTLNMLVTWKSLVREVIYKKLLFKGRCDNGELTASLNKGNNNHTFRTYFLVERKLRTTVKCNLLITTFQLIGGMGYRSG
jgi:hypothetical protein